MKPNTLSWFALIAPYAIAIVRAQLPVVDTTLDPNFMILSLTGGAKNSIIRATQDQIGDFRPSQLLASIATITKIGTNVSSTANCQVLSVSPDGTLRSGNLITQGGPVQVFVAPFRWDELDCASEPRQSPPSVDLQFLNSDKTLEFVGKVQVRQAVLGDAPVPVGVNVSAVVEWQIVQSTGLFPTQISCQAFADLDATQPIGPVLTGDGPSIFDNGNPVDILLVECAEI